MSRNDHNSGTTLVSAFISNFNNRSDRTTEDYIKFGKQLLELSIPKIIFIEEKYESLVKRLSHPNTNIIPFEKSELEFFREIESIELELPNIRNLEKDTKEYMCLMSNKTFFCKKAIALNPYLHDKFVWMDFGISHILHGEPLINLIKEDYSFTIDKVRIGHIWSESIANQCDPLQRINWFFAGGAFGGNSEALLRFHHECTHQFIENLKINKITWEVNLWRQVYLKSPDLFDTYLSDHDRSLIINI